MPNLTASAATFENEDEEGSVENPVAKDSALSPKPHFSEEDDLDIGCMSPRPGDDGGECVDRGGSGQEVPAWIVDAKKKMVWDVLMLFLILYSVLIIPWALGFDVPLYDYDTSFHATLLCISITVSGSPQSNSARAHGLWFGMLNSGLVPNHRWILLLCWIWP